MSTGTPPSRSYWCFISYRHADNKEPGRQWATWLQQAIETYEVPADLIGTKNERGDTIPERIFPVFRDEEELPVDADLASPIYRALEASKFLVVICSPRAVESTYVASEISYFKQLGREDRVLAAMIEGEPNVSRDISKQAQGFKPEKECFPEPLLHGVDKEGRQLAIQTEPIAADFRLRYGLQGWTTSEAFRQALKAEGKDPEVIKAWVAGYHRKFELMKLKIMAGILGVPLGILTQREKAYQLAVAQKRNRVLRRWLVTICLLFIFLLAAVAAGVEERVQEQMAVESKNRTEQSADTSDKLEKVAQLETERADAAVVAALQIAGETQRAHQDWLTLLATEPRWQNKEFRQKQKLDPIIEKALASISNK
jgi:Na+-transporting methylmalonyl-CoA/oxaloacetate decarboxylase gamma subunit